MFLFKCRWGGGQREDNDHGGRTTEDNRTKDSDKDRREQRTMGSRTSARTGQRRRAVVSEVFTVLFKKKTDKQN